jgi:hypothetical protein
MLEVVEVAILLVLCYLTYTLWRDSYRRRTTLPLLLSLTVTLLFLDSVIFTMENPLRWWILSQSWSEPVVPIWRLLSEVVWVGTVAIALIALAINMWRRRGTGKR